MASRLNLSHAGRLRIAGWLCLAVLTGLFAASSAKAETFTNPAPLNWSSLSSPQPWQPYPSPITVPPTTGTVGTATVTFHGFQAANLGFMNFMLVGPGGERVILASDFSFSAYGPNSIDLGFADNGTTYPEGANYPEAGVTLVIKPFNSNTANDTIWSAPAPSGEGAPSSLEVAFKGIDPGGTWRLFGYGFSSFSAEYGQIASGWSLNLEIEPPPPPPPPPTPPPPETSVPSLTSLTIAPAGFRAANIGGSTVAISSRSRAPVGGKVFFNLSDDGTAYFKAKRLARGFRKGKRCKPPGKVPRKMRHKKCTRVAPVKGGFQVAGTEGLNAFTFTGRINGRPLRPGKYRLIARASADGAAFSAPLGAKFRIRK